MAYWSSYNCWTVVRLKRFIESNSDDKNNADETASSVDGGASSVQQQASRIQMLESGPMDKPFSRT